MVSDRLECEDEKLNTVGASIITNFLVPDSYYSHSTTVPHTSNGSQGDSGNCSGPYSSRACFEGWGTLPPL